MPQPAKVPAWVKLCLWIYMGRCCRRQRLHTCAVLPAGAKAVVAAQIRAQLAACGAPLLGDTLYRHAALCPVDSASRACCSAAALHGHTGPDGDGEALELESSAQTAGDGGALEGLLQAAGARARLRCGARADKGECTEVDKRTGVAGGMPSCCDDTVLRDQGPKAAVCTSRCRTSFADRCSCSLDLHEKTEQPPRRPAAIGLQAWRLEIEDSRGLFGEAAVAVFEATRPWWKDT